MNSKKYTYFTDYYLFYMSCMSLVILYFNFYAQSMGRLLPSYRAFAKIIRAGIDPSVTNYYPLTFPMWGYGFLMAITENHFILLLLQLLLALFSVWSLIRTLELYVLLPSAYMSLLKVLFIVNVPWYAFHTVKWPYSISSSLFLISIILLYRAREEKNCLYYIILSGMTFGLLLNFRSDYILMPVGLGALLVYFQPSFLTLKKIFLWMVCIYIFLLPWALFTKRVCDHYLVSSTNGGHHALSGLGNFSNNKWGISPSNGDNCPVIHKFVDEVYGNNACTWDYKGDQVLKKKYFELIMADPWEYVIKCCVAATKVFSEGVYNGEFFRTSEGGRKESFDLGTLSLIKRALHERILILDFVGIKLQNFSYWVASYVTLVFYVLFPVILFLALSSKDIFFILISASIVYQLALNIFMHHYSAYLSNVFLLMIVLLVYLLSKMQIKKYSIYEKN